MDIGPWSRPSWVLGLGGSQLAEARASTMIAQGDGEDRLFDVVCENAIMVEPRQKKG
jgi:hypothetical protein